ANGVWFAYTQLNTPELPVAALPIPRELLPTPTPLTTIAPTPVATPMPTAITMVFNTMGAANPNQANNAAAPLFAGIIPVLMLLAGLFVVTKSRRASPY